MKQQMADIGYRRLRKLSERIWHYLNGRYENFDKETTRIAEMIDAEIQRERRKRD